MLVNILKYMSELCKPSPLELDVLLYSSPTDFMPLRYTANWNSHQNIYSSHATSIEHKRTAQKFFNSCELTLKFIIRANCKEQLGVNKSTC